MNAAELIRARIALREELERPIHGPHRRRFVLTAAVAALTWFLFLLGFAYVLKPPKRPPVHPRSIEMRILDVPPSPPKKVEVPPPRAEPAKAIPRRAAIAPKRPIAPRVRIAKPEGMNKPPAAIPGSPYGGAAVSGEAGVMGGEVGGSGGGGPGAITGSTVGARALYDPAPSLPDDLRENAFSAEAVAHFIVNSDGTVQVSLTQPTPDPRLNQLILDTLRQWKFFPAMKDGVAIASELDVRIPISVE
jgi:periplasmic protein TonB